MLSFFRFSAMLSTPSVLKCSCRSCCPPGLGGSNFWKSLATRSNPRENPAPWNCLGCHCYCLPWYVNSFIGLCNSILWPENFFQIRWKTVSLLKWSSVSRDSLYENWISFTSWRDEPFSLFSKLFIFRNKTLVKACLIISACFRMSLFPIGFFFKTIL